MLVFSCLGARAIEVTSVFYQDCKIARGFVIKVTDTQIEILGDQGVVNSLDVDKIQAVFIHDLIEFPFVAQEISRPLEWFRVKLLDGSRTEFVGVPIYFVDDLVFFLNRKGEIEVINFALIGGLETQQIQELSWGGSKQAFDYSAAADRCPGSGKSQGLIPSRVIMDPIQLSEHLRNYSAGFEKLDSLSERMKFYALPQMYKNSSRLGLILPVKSPEIPTSTAVLNVKSSSSIPFGLQNSMELLSIRNRWVPFSFPFMGASFEIKSHLFHGLLVAHAPSISGGSSYFENVIETSFDGARFADSYFENGSKFVLLRAFNYLTMFGADYANWTVSFGGFYPIHYAYFLDQERELLSSSPQPVVRVMYTGTRSRSWIVGGTFNQTHTTDFANQTLLAKDNYQRVENLKARSSGFFGKVGYDFAVDSEIDFRLEYTNYDWKFDDDNQFQARSQDQTLSAELSKDFGRYTGIRAYFNYFKNTWSANSQIQPISKEISGQTFGGEFEFIF